MKSYFRPEINALAGYVPGEQPKLTRLVKLKTNENPYPPSPEVCRALQSLDPDRLRRYPDPNCDRLRSAVAERWGVGMDQVIFGNGSDDILTMIFRAFTDQERPVAVPEPTYSLYPVLAAMQGAKTIRISLNPGDFSLPEDFLAQASGANLLAIARPNAPTGNNFPLETIRQICAGFDGVVLIDEAYADFAEDNCAALVKEFANVIVSRTFSKSYSLAGTRLGYAVSSPEIISGLFKLKDSYNVDAATQEVGLAAYLDTAYLADCVAKVKMSREALRRDLLELGFAVGESQTNFLWASPPDGNGEAYFRFLRERAIIVRYFPGESTGKFVRITIGTPDAMAELMAATREFCTAEK